MKTKIIAFSYWLYFIINIGVRICLGGDLELDSSVKQ